jgi:predicted transcriptional regulator
MKRVTASEWAIMELLNRHPEGLNFDTIAEKLKKGEGAKTIKSRNTVSNHLKRLIKEGRVERDVDSRKYFLTDKAKDEITLWDITDEILQCQYYDTVYAVDWTLWKDKPEMISRSAWFIQQEKEASPYAVLIPIEAIRFGYSTPESKINRWLTVILKCVKEHGEKIGLSEQSTIEEVWKAFFQRAEKIIIVETLNPSLLYEKLQSLGIKKLEDIPPIAEEIRIEKHLITKYLKNFQQK